MTDDKDGGSDSGIGGAQAGAAGAKGTGANKIAKMSMDQALVELEQVRKAVGEKDRMITDLTSQLEEANKVLEAQDKAKLIGEILPRSSFKMDELLSKTMDELNSIRATLDQARLPKVNSARFGVQAADVSDREKGLTVGDLSWSTAQKRKAAPGVG